MIALMSKYYYQAVTQRSYHDANKWKKYESPWGKSLVLKGEGRREYLTMALPE